MHYRYVNQLPLAPENKPEELQRIRAERQLTQILTLAMPILGIPYKFACVNVTNEVVSVEHDPFDKMVHDTIGECDLGLLLQTLLSYQPLDKAKVREAVHKVTGRWLYHWKDEDLAYYDQPIDEILIYWGIGYASADGKVSTLTQHMKKRKRTRALAFMAWRGLHPDYKTTPDEQRVNE